MLNLSAEGGAVLLKKRRSYAECYNDLDGEIVNLFKVVRDNGSRLKELIYYTPYSRKEFELSYEPTEDSIEQARRTIVRSFMGYGSASSVGNHWVNYPEGFDYYIERLRGVVIENRDAKEVIQQHDSSRTLHYIDPPYVLDTRYAKQKSKCYKFEMTDDEHFMLVEMLAGLRGNVIISGYDNDIYESVLVVKNKWFKFSTGHIADGGSSRTEVLWTNFHPPTKPPELFS